MGPVRDFYKILIFTILQMEGGTMRGCPQGGKYRQEEGNMSFTSLRGNLHYFDSSQGASIVLR